MNTPKIGLALGSGGPRGIAHVGVLKTLEKHAIPVDYIAGSSIGAVVGAYYAHHPSASALEEMTHKLSERNLSSLLDITIKGGILKGIKLEKLLEETLGDATFDSLKIPYAAVTTDLINANTVALRKGNLIKAVRASLSIPGLFLPVTYEKRILADGGLSNPVPVDVVRSMGADIVIAVNLDKLYVENEATAVVPPLTKLPLHSINILRHHLALQSGKRADALITPVVAAGSIWLKDFFIRTKVDGAIAEGERATEAQIPIIKDLIGSFNKPSVFNRLLSFIHRSKA